MTETIPEMLWSASPEGAIDYCNTRLLDFTGFSAEEVMGDGWTKLIHPDDIEQAARAWMCSVTTGSPYRVEVRTFHASDRTYRWCVTNARPLLDQQGRILKWHGTVVDMHDWKQAQEELRITQANLARVMRVSTMGELTASIAHEVNQPLSGIITNASTSLRMLAADPPNIEKAERAAERIVAEASRASEVIARVRGLASGKSPIRGAFDLGTLTWAALTDHSDGLSCLREIVAGAPVHLLTGGWLLVEHGYDQGAAVRGLFAAAGFEQVTTRSEMMFQQVEGLAVGEGITLADLKGTIQAFARRIFGPERCSASNRDCSRRGCIRLSASRR